MRPRRRLAWCFALLLPVAQPVAAQVRPAVPPPAADLSSPPPDIQAIIKKLLGGAGPTPDEAKRFNEYDQTHHDVIVRSMDALRDSLMHKAAPPPPSPSTATVTIVGALNTTRSVPVVAAFEAATNESAVELSSMAMPAFAIGVKVGGDLRIGTYTSSTAGISGKMEVTGASGAPWIAAKAWPGSKDQGTFTLTLTAVVLQTASSQGKAYVVHGTLTATLPATGTIATGPVTMLASF